MSLHSPSVAAVPWLNMCWVFCTHHGLTARAALQCFAVSIMIWCQISMTGYWSTSPDSAFPPLLFWLKCDWLESLPPTKKINCIYMEKRNETRMAFTSPNTIESHWTSKRGTRKRVKEAKWSPLLTTSFLFSFLLLSFSSFTWPDTWRGEPLTAH